MGAFGGIFYHLPDPIGGLKISADLTNERLIVNSATRNDSPDWLLYALEESRSQLLSGAYGLASFPTRPEVIRRILAWLGFPEVRVDYWLKEGVFQLPELGRLHLYAARKPETFAAFDAHRSRAESGC